MVTRKIIHLSEEDPGGPGRCWYIRHQDVDDESQIAGHTIFKVAFTAVSAEYGIDLDDIDTLMDVVLHRHKDTTDNDHPDHVFNLSEDEAREKMLARIAEIKKDYQIVDPDNLLQAIRDHHKIHRYTADHAKIKERADIIRKHR